MRSRFLTGLDLFLYIGIDFFYIYCILIIEGREKEKEMSEETRQVTEEPKVQVLVSLGRYGSKEEFENLKARLDGTTMMNFRVIKCPAGGEFEVFVETYYTAPKDEVRDFILYVLASNVALGKG